MSTPLPTLNFSQFSISPVFMSFQPLCGTHEPRSTRKPPGINHLQSLVKLTGYAAHFASSPPLRFTHYVFETSSLTLSWSISNGARHAHLARTACHSCVSVLQDNRETYSRPVRPQMPVANVSAGLPNPRRYSRDVDRGSHDRARMTPRPRKSHAQLIY